MGDDSGVAKGDNKILDGQDLFVSCWLRTRIESAVFIVVKGGSCSCGDGEDDACSLELVTKGCDGACCCCLLLSTHRIRSSTTIFGRQIPCLFTSRLSTQPSRQRCETGPVHTRMITTLRASPFAAIPAGPVPSFFGRIGLSLLEFTPGDGDEESSRLGRIRIAKTELAQARAGRVTHVQVAVSIVREGQGQASAMVLYGLCCCSAVLCCALQLQCSAVKCYRRADGWRGWWQ